MPKLSSQDREYLTDKGIPLSDLFDATGLKRSEYRARMKELDVHYAFGTSACGRGGHRLRSRTGHCIVCDPQSISQTSRYHRKGFVYIAHSRSGGLIKVGMTTDLIEREKQLNIYSYGGVSDWRIVKSALAGRAGETEAKIHRELRDSSITGFYSKAGQRIACYELFECTFDVAHLAMKAVITAKPKQSRPDR